MAIGIIVPAHRANIGCCLSLATLTMALATPARAQDQGPGQDQTEGVGSAQIEDIVVTAQKRAENVQDVPVAISAFSAEALKQAGFNSFADLQALSPGLQLGNFGPVTFVNLRGIGNENTTAGGDPGVALHYDGVYLGRPVAYLFSAFDSERVEVLRGPQGTLYGRNATGGSINYITKKPTDTFSVDADLTYGTYNLVRGQGAINVPLSDGVRARVVGFGERRDGFTENPFPGGRNPNDAQNYGFRGHLAFDVGSEGSLLLSATYFKAGGVGTKSELREAYPGTTTTPIRPISGPPGFAFSGGPASGIPGGNTYITPSGAVAVNDLRPFHEETDAPQRQDSKFFLASATFDYDLGPVSVKSISAYVRTSYLSLQDEDHSALPLSVLLLTEDARQYTQELQLLSSGNGPLKWIVGGFYFNENANRRSQFFGGRYDVFAGIFGVPSGFDVGGNVKTESFAAFGQATYDLTSALSFTGGIRYSNDTKEGINRGFQFAGAPYADPVRGHWDSITYRLVADYHITKDILVYGGYSTGYRSGGINQTAAISLGAVNAVYDPERVGAAEIGLKSQFFDRRAQFNLSLYRNRYSDLQFQIFGPAGPEAFNSAGALVQGIELETVAVASNHLNLNFNAGYIDSSFDTQVIDGNQIGGNQVQRAPKWTVSAGATYDWDFGKAGSLKLKGDYAYTDRIYYTALNRNAGFGDPGGSDLARAYSNVNLRLFWTSANDKWTVAVEATNLFDTAQEGNVFRGIGFLDIAGGGGTEEITYNPPRQVSGRVGFRF